MLNRVVEMRGQEQGKRETRNIIALLHGTNCLTGDANGLRKLFLRYLLFLAELPETVIDGVFVCHKPDNYIRHR